MKKRLLVATGQPLLAHGIEAVLRESSDFEPVGRTSDAAAISGLVLELEADVLLLDAPLLADPHVSIPHLKQASPLLMAVVMGPSSNLVQIHSAFDNGAAGYIVRGVEPDELVGALRAIDGSRGFMVAGVPPGWRRQAGPLTRREREIVEAAGRGLSNKSIAAMLWLSEQTVKFHLSNAYRKLGVSNRTEAGYAAFQLNLLETDPDS